MHFFRRGEWSGAGLMPRARWLFGCNKIAAYKTRGCRGTATDRTRDGFNGANGRDGANGPFEVRWLIFSGFYVRQAKC